MQTEIVTRVAELIRNPSSVKKSQLEKSSEVARKESVQDRVEISKAALEKQQGTENIGQYQQEREARVESLKARIDNGSYTMDEAMVDDIAKKIVDLI